MNVETIEAAFEEWCKTLKVVDRPSNQDIFGQGYVAGWNAKEADMSGALAEGAGGIPASDRGQSPDKGGSSNLPSGPHLLEDTYILPCDVRMEPATVIRKGCTLRTLMAAFKAREGMDWNNFDLADCKETLARYRSVFEAINRTKAIQNLSLELDAELAATLNAEESKND